MFTLIRGANVYAPDPLGVRDILIAAGRIARIAESIDPPAGFEVDRVEAAGKTVTPGFIDLHAHLTGGGGEGGPATRVPEIQLSQITTAGVTTVLGVLGTDDVSRHPETLLTKAQGLEQEGITAFVLCGSYRFPDVVTVTGSVRKDIALIPHIVGVGEIALSDHRSAQPTFEDLAKVAADARVGGLLGGKAGLIQLHMGGGPRGFEYLFRLARETEIPIGQLLPTHVTRTEALLDQAIAFAQMGGNIDITVRGKGPSDRTSAGEALTKIRSAGVSLERITLSSDANGSLPAFDAQGTLVGLKAARMQNLIDEFRTLVTDGGIAVEDLLACFTRNPARRINIGGRKGTLAEGKDADLVVFGPDWQVDQVYARGRRMVAEGRAVVRGMFE